MPYRKGAVIKMELLGVWKLKKMISLGKGGFRMVDAAEIEKMEESPMKKEYQRMLEADFIISESSLEILYRPHEGEESLAAEKGWTVTGEGFVIERFPARIEDGVLMLDYKKDGTGYFPVFWDEEDCLSISGGIMKIQKA